jgi:hypothetical protein
MSFNRWLRARWTLGAQLARHVATTPFRKQRGGAAWLAKLRTERLAPTPTGAWELFEPASRCIGCGLCDAVARDSEQPSAWILGEARTPSDAPLALDHARRLHELAKDIARVCPTGVGVDEIAQLIDKNAAELGDHAPTTGRS